jgi:RNA polymerase sigma-70 factor (ECF subfamily)
MQDRNIVNLAKKAIKGDRKAFEALIYEKQRRILFTAMSILKNEADAQDAAQDAILKMYGGIGKLRNPEAVSAWMEKIVRNECYRIYNIRYPHNAEANIDDEEVAAEVLEESREFLPEAYAEDSDMKERLYRIILALSPAKRDAIFMYYYEGLSYKEIAQVTGTNEKAVSANLSRARTELKHRLLGDESMKQAASIPAVAIMANPPAQTLQTVIGKALESQSMKVLSDEKLIGFEQKWRTAVESAPRPAKKSSTGKAAIAAAAAAVFLIGIYGAVTLGGTGAEQPAPAAATGREIVLVSDDCECGHLNPLSAAIGSPVKGDGEPVWEIITAEGVSVFSGDEQAVSAELQQLSVAHEDGEYTLKSCFKDKNDYEVILKRQFTIGRQ